MVLAAASVWIRSLAGREPFTRELKRLLLMDQVVGHELVYGELLIGDLGGRKKTLAGFDRMFQATTVPHTDVVAFVDGIRTGAGSAGLMFTFWPLLSLAV